VRRALIATAAVVLGAAALAGWTRLRGWVREDPRFCAACHKASAEFALWSSDGHARVACQKCHHTTPEQGVQMLRAFIAGRAPGGGGGHAPVEIGSCAACHLSHDKQWIDVGASRGHRVHAVEQKIACVRCHGAAVHRFEPSTESCRSCHGDHAVRVPGMQKLHCFACHDFLSVEGTLRPTRRDCLRCHQAQGVHPARFPEDAPMRFACASCHKPHAQAGAELTECRTCHADQVSSGLHARHGACRECHRAHAWRSEVAGCVRCHRGAAAHDPTLTCRTCHSWRGDRGARNLPRGR
jgi:hypothetical protein